MAARRCLWFAGVEADLTNLRTSCVQPQRPRDAALKFRRLKEQRKEVRRCGDVYYFFQANLWRWESHGRQLQRQHFSFIIDKLQVRNSIFLKATTDIFISDNLISTNNNAIDGVIMRIVPDNIPAPTDIDGPHLYSWHCNCPTVETMKGIFLSLRRDLIPS